MTTKNIVTGLILRGDATGATQALKTTRTELDKTTQRVNGTSGAIKKMGGNTTDLAKKMAGLAATAFSVTKLVQYSNSWTDLNSRVLNATGSQQVAADVMRAIGQTARGTYSSLNQTAEAYLDNAMALTELGFSTEKQIALSAALNNALVVSGTKGQQAESVMNALSKSFALGKLSGDDFNTVIQSGGRVAKALADGLGVSTLELRQLAADGFLTTERVVEALTSQMETLREEAGNMPATMGDAGVLMGNSLQKLTGTLNDVTGASTTVAESIILIADKIDALSNSLSSGELDGYIDGISTAATVLGAVLIGRLTAGVVSTGVSMAAGIAESIRYQAALASMAGVSGRAAASITAMGVASRGASASMALLGGPVSVGIAVASLGAYMLSTRSASASTADLIEKTHQLTGNYKALQSQQLQQTLQDIDNQIATLKVRVFSNQDKGLLQVLFGDAGEMRKEQEQLYSAYQQAIKARDALAQKIKTGDGGDSRTPKIAASDWVWGDYELEQAILAEAALNKAAEAEEKLKQTQAERYAAARYEQELNLAFERALHEEGFVLADQQDELLVKMTDAVGSYGDAWTRTGNQALDAMGSMLSMLGQLGAAEKQNAELMQKAQEKGLSGVAEFMALERQRVQMSLSGTAQMMGAASAMFKQGSKEQQLAHKASLVLHTITLGMELKKQIAAATTATVVNQANASTAVSGATASVASAGTGDPYTAPLRVIAMSAMMAGVLSQMGLSFGRASGASAGYSAVPMPTDGGTLSGVESESVSNITSLLLDVNSDQYRELRGINQGIKNLNASLTGTVKTLYSTGDISRLSSGATASKIGNADFMFDIKNQVSKLPLGLGLISGLTAGLLGNIGNAIFGGTTKTSTDYGLNIGGTLGNVSVAGFETIKTEKNGGWFGKTKTTYDDKVRSVSDDTQDMLQSVFANIGASMVEVGKALDMDVTNAVNSFGINIGKISLQGSADEVQKRLEQAINAQSDKLANVLFGDLAKQYQKLNEGIFETISRLVIEKTVVSDIVGMTGQTMVGDAIALSQSLIEIAGGLDVLRDAADNYFDKFFSENEKLQRNYDQLVDRIGDMNLALPDSRDGYRALVESLDLTSDAGQAAYVTLINLSDQADKHYGQIEKLEDELTKTRMSGLQSLLNGLRQAQNAILGSVTSDSVMYMTAQNSIADVLDLARSGTLPQYDAIKDALGAVSRNSMDNYATYADFAFDQAYTAAMIGELAGYTENQISIEEQMLNSALDQTDLLTQIRDGIYMGATGGYVSTPIPGFASGGIHSGGWRIVGENGPELEFTQPSRIFNHNQTSKMLDNTELANELRAIKAELAALRAQDRQIGVELIKSTRDTNDTLEKWDVIGLPTTQEAIV